MNDHYDIEPRNPFFEMAAAIIQHEIKPHHKVTFFSQVDLSQIEAIRRDHDVRGLPRPSYTAFVVKALALALRDHPDANRRVIGAMVPFCRRPRLQRFRHVDVTVAIERQIAGAPMAAFVDILRDVDAMPLDDVHRRLKSLSDSDAENNRQWRDFSRLVTRFPTWFAALLVRLPLYLPALWVKYRGAAAMVSAPGKYGVDTVCANWWSPIGVSFGVVAMRPVVVEQTVVARPTFNMTLNFDVRVMAGAQAAHFCRRLLDILEDARTELRPWLTERVAPAPAPAPSTAPSTAPRGEEQAAASHAELLI